MRYFISFLFFANISSEKCIFFLKKYYLFFIYFYSCYVEMISGHAPPSLFPSTSTTSFTSIPSIPSSIPLSTSSSTSTSSARGRGNSLHMLQSPYQDNKHEYSTQQHLEYLQRQAFLQAKSPAVYIISLSLSLFFKYLSFYYLFSNISFFINISLLSLFLIFYTECFL